MTDQMMLAQLEARKQLAEAAQARVAYWEAELAKNGRALTALEEAFRENSKVARHLFMITKESLSLSKSEATHAKKLLQTFQTKMGVDII